MKKVVLVLVSLALVSTCFALESGPSNKVGYVKITAVGGTGDVFTPFGLPFKFWDVPAGNVPTYGVESRIPSDIIGTQARCGAAIGTPVPDRIIRQDNGRFANRLSPSCNWTGLLETNVPEEMTPGRAYFFRNSGRNNTAVDLVLAGEADITAVGVPGVQMNAPAVAGGIVYTPYSWRDPRQVARNQLNLLAQGFQGGVAFPAANYDLVLEQGTGANFWYNTGTSAWTGTLASVTPGRAYFVGNRNVGTTFTYTYNASGVPIVMPGGDHEISKISTPANIETSKSSATHK